MDKIFGNLLGPSKIWWLIRQVLQFGGLWLVASGYADQDTVNTATETILSVAAGIGVLIGFGANIYSTFRETATVGGEKVPLPAMPAEVQKEVKAEAKKVIKNRSIFENIFGQHKT
jgi:hypothetical protein